MKVLVHCLGREVRAATGRVWDSEGNLHLRYRQFEAIGKSNYGRAYMTPEEAEFLVESAENRARGDQDLPLKYFYPAGFPAPVADSYDGSLPPPLTDKSFHVSDSRQIEKASVLIAERDAAMAAGKSDVDPATQLVESAEASRTRNVKVAE